MPDIASLVARVSIVLSVAGGISACARGRTRSSRRGLGADHGPGRDTPGRVAACRWLASGKSRRVVERAVCGLAGLRRRRLVSHALHRGGIEGGRSACCCALAPSTTRPRCSSTARPQAVTRARTRPSRSTSQSRVKPGTNELVVRVIDPPAAGRGRDPRFPQFNYDELPQGQAELVHPERRLVAARVARRPPGALHRRGPRLVEGVGRHRRRRRHRRHGAQARRVR